MWDENLTKLFKQSSSEFKAGSGKTYLHTMKSHDNTTGAHLLSQPPTGAHKEFAFSLFKEKKNTPSHRWPKLKQLQSFQHSTQAANDQGILQGPLSQLFKSRWSLTCRELAEPSSPGPAGPGTVPPSGTACGSAPWGPTRQAQCGDHRRRGPAPPPTRVSPPRPWPRPPRARKQGQGYCRAGLRAR